MRAPVYRHLDSKAAFLGISFPIEWSLILLAVVLGERTVGIFSGLAAATALYVFLRFVGYGRADNHLQDWILFRLRHTFGGHFSTAERGLRPRYPYAPYLSRDRSSRR